MIWLVCAALCLGTMAILAGPVWRGKGARVNRADYDLTVYKDQLGELDRDVERGVLNHEQAQAARLEIQRRILAVAEQQETGSALSSQRSLLLGMIGLVVPVLGVGLYLVVGQPQMPDLPHSARAGQMQQMQDQQAMIQGMVQSLQTRLEKDPNDAKGWTMLGRSLKVLGQKESAAQAYRKAMALSPTDPVVMMEYGGLLLSQVPQGSMLPPEFVALMRKVVSLTPDNLDALYFLGVAEAQAGNNAKAKELWVQVMMQLPEGSAERADIQQQINELN